MKMGKLQKGPKCCAKKTRTASIPFRSGYVQKKCQQPILYKTRGRAARIDELPEEIVLKIFSYLPVAELYKNVRLVNCQWWRIAATPSLWTSIRVGPNIPSDELSNWLDYAPQLRSLELYNRNDAGAVLHQVSKRNKEIEKLQVHNCWGSEKNRNLPSVPLCRILTRCPYLSQISLRGSRFVSCKFFRLLFTRDELIAKRRLKRKRKTYSMEVLGDFTCKQLRAFLRVRLDSGLRNIAWLTMESHDRDVVPILEFLNGSNLAENDTELDSIINMIFNV